MNINQTTILALKNFPDLFELFFYAIPKESWHWSPESWEGVPSESFNAIEQICHIRDIEIDGYHIRLNRILNETNPTLDFVDGYALVKEKNYAQADPVLVFEKIRTARAETLRLLEDLDETQLSRTGYFEGYGQLTTLGLVHYLCSHDQQHLSGLQWLLGRIESNKNQSN